MGKIVAIGANVMDTLVTLPQYPTQDTKMRAISFIQAGGGPAATGLVAASVLGAECAFIGNYTDDAGGDYLYNDFHKFGVSTEYMTKLSGYRTFSSQIWLSQSNATRTCVFDKGTVLPLVLNERQKCAIIDADLLMIDGNELSAAIEAANLAKNNGTTVLYDAGGLYDGVENLLSLCDIMIPSREFALGITKENNVENAAKMLYNDYKPKVVVITCGKDGGALYDGESFIKYPIYPAQVVDSNGAGDVFHGAFAAGLTFGLSYIDCCHYASATSALKCKKLGAREAVPTHDEVIKLLKTNNYTLQRKDTIL